MGVENPISGYKKYIVERSRRWAPGCVGLILVVGGVCQGVSNLLSGQNAEVDYMAPYTFKGDGFLLARAGMVEFTLQDTRVGNFGFEERVSYLMGVAKDLEENWSCDVDDVMVSANVGELLIVSRSECIMSEEKDN